jgi:hypothetical protein
MTSRGVAAGALALMAAAPACGLEPDQWQHRQALPVPNPGVVRLLLPPETLDLARANLEDLRLLDPAGQEMPFLLERVTPSPPPAVRPPVAFRVELGDGFTRLLIETGSATPFVAVTLVSPAPNFLKAARLEFSDDGARWQTAQSGVPVFRQFGAEQVRLEFAARVAAFARITLDDARTRPVPFTGATLDLATPAPPPLTRPLPVRIANREEFAGETLLTLDVGARHVPLAEFEFVTPDPLFARTVRVTTRELRDDLAVERTLATGTIYRVAADGLAPSARLQVPVNFNAPARELLVHVSNQDSPPLAIEEIRALQRPVWIVFRASVAGSHRLLTGNPDIAAPHYDLALLAGALREAPPSGLAPGPVERNPGYRRADALVAAPLLGGALDPAPWPFRKAVKLLAGGVQQLELDLDVLARAQRDFADLRLVRDQAQVPYVLERPTLTRATAVPLRSNPDPKRPRVSRWELKLPRPGLPLVRLTLTSPDALFQRRLQLAERVTDARGATHERALATGDWTKTPGSEPPLVIPLGVAPTTDTLWLETDNGDNPPLALTPTAQVQYPVARLLFRAEPGPLALYYGHRQATAPHYDVRLIAGQLFAAEKNVATLDAEQPARAEGWASGTLARLRGGVAFWGALILVVLVLLGIVAKLLPKPPA